MWTHRIEIDPNVMLGKPVVKGTRIPVELVLRKLGEGATMDDLRDAYPRLMPKAVSACLAYAEAGAGTGGTGDPPVSPDP